MDKLTDDLLTVISMRHGWITRREILTALDMPTLSFPDGVRDRLRKLEQCGLIESRKVKVQGFVCEYRAMAKAWEG